VRLLPALSLFSSILIAPLAGCEPPPSSIAPAGEGGAGGGNGGSGDGGSGGGGQADAGTSSDGAAGSDAAVGPRPFTVIVLPDTQYYSEGYPQIFDAQANWIVANKDVLNIAFVLHEGDIVDWDIPEQWLNASRSLHRLDHVVPYFISVGNHDIGGGCPPGRGCRNTMINQYFPVADFAARPWFGGTFEPDHIENNYGIINVQGTSWLVMALEFGPRTQVLDWANSVLSAHADMPAVIVTHAYLYNDGTRYDRTTRPEQLWSPHNYDLDWLPGGVNDGEAMWQALVSKHDNVEFVLSGHVLPPDEYVNPDTAARLTSTRDSGTHCHQVLANYQTCSGFPCPATMGGNGFLRIMRFDPVTHAVSVRTYSPYLDLYKTDLPNQFDLGGD
jgi:hypothetical protein